MASDVEDASAAKDASGAEDTSEAEESNFVIEPSWFVYSYDPSIAALETLQKIHVEDFEEEEKHYEGYYIILRVKEPPDSPDTFCASMVDERGGTIATYVFQCEGKGFCTADKVCYPRTYNLLSSFMRCYFDGVPSPDLAGTLCTQITM